MNHGYFLTLGSGGGGNQNDIINTGSFKVEVDSVGTSTINQIYQNQLGAYGA